jgi:2-dehydro-3-deoxy-L-rhamnonate dehydrogenase (NAD+)
VNGRPDSEGRRNVSYDFSGQTAIVTGGAGGIGSAVVRRLNDSGARVWIWDLDRDELAGGRSLPVDVTNQDQVAAAVDTVIAQDARLDILVNSAGHLGPHVPFEQLSPAEWQRIIDVNLVGVLVPCHHVLPHMRRGGGGRIVNIGSLAGKHGLPKLPVYSAASAGVIAFTKALAQELAATEIRVNSVAPGPIETDLITGLGPEVVDMFVASSPMRRLGDPHEVAELVVWLCSSACSFTTGAVFDVSGGRAAY